MRSKHASRQSIRGISLIEVLISVTIGLVVLAAVIVSYVGSGKASRHQAALTQMNQDAQIGLNLLSREIQLAGYSAPSALTNTAAAGSTPVFVVSYNLGTVTAPIFGCDVNQSVGTFVDPTAVNLVCGNNGATPTFSGLGVIYEADAKNTVPSAVGVPTDCLGGTIAAEAGGYYLARNRYFVDKATGANASGRPELFCASNKAGASKQPLLENVEDMQIWYGVGAGGGSRQVIRYAKAGKDATTPNTVNAVGATEWANVIGVRVCLLMRSAEPILQSGGEDTVRYFDCDAVPHDSADGYLRRAYFTTSTLRSKMAF